MLKSVKLDCRVEKKATDHKIVTVTDNLPPNGKWFFPVSRWLHKAHEDAPGQWEAAKQRARQKGLDYYVKNGRKIYFG